MHQIWRFCHDVDVVLGNKWIYITVEVHGLTSQTEPMEQMRLKAEAVLDAAGSVSLKLTIVQLKPNILGIFLVP